MMDVNQYISMETSSERGPESWPHIDGTGWRGCLQPNPSGAFGAGGVATPVEALPSLSRRGGRPLSHLPSGGGSAAGSPVGAEGEGAPPPGAGRERGRRFGMRRRGSNRFKRALEGGVAGGKAAP
jgi:hypothetical protein